jgi:hypothetical protein
MDWVARHYLSVIFLVLSSNQLLAEVSAPYCASFNATDNSVSIPCVTYRGSAYSAKLNLTNSDPMRFVISELSTSSLPAVAGQCATYNDETGNIGLPPDGCIPLTNPGSGTTVTVSGKGEASFDVAVVQVRNNTNQRQCYCIGPCTLLKNSMADQQDLTVARSASVCLESGQAGEVGVYGFCANAEKSTPTNLVPMSITMETRNDLCALTQAIERAGDDPTSAGIAQFAVWAMTDLQNPVTGTLEKIKTLYREAGLEPATYPGLAQELSLPADIPVNLPFEIPTGITTE